MLDIVHRVWQRARQAVNTGLSGMFLHMERSCTTSQTRDGLTVTLLVDVRPVCVRKSLDLPLKLLVFLLDLLLQVFLIWAHGQGQSVAVLLSEGEDLPFFLLLLKGGMTKRSPAVCLSHLEVLPDFVLQEVRVFLQGLPEARDALVDLQQLHRVAVVVP